jgi:hypothetical protein
VFRDGATSEPLLRFSGVIACRAVPPGGGGASAPDGINPEAATVVGRFA